VIAHESMHDPVSDGVAGAAVAIGSEVHPREADRRRQRDSRPPARSQHIVIPPVRRPSDRPLDPGPSRRVGSLP